MAKRKLVHAATVSGLSLFILPALAQEKQQGIEMTLDFKQELESGDNLSLDRPEAGHSTVSTTTLGFGLLSETQTQVFSLDGSVKLREGWLATGTDIDTGIVEPRVALRYSRESANSLLEVTGSYRQTDIAFEPAVSDFTDPTTGTITLPSDFDDLDGSGTRRNYAFGTTLELARNAPLSFVFSTDINGLSYKDQGPNLDDTYHHNFSARANLRFSPLTTGFVQYSYRYYDADDLIDTNHKTNAFELGVVKEVSERTSLEAAIGYSKTKEDTTIFDRDDSGLIGRFLVNHEMPNGNLSASYVTTRDQDGARNELSFGRSLDLPRGSFAVSIGATNKDGNDLRMIGSLRYLHELPTGNIILGFNRQVSIDEDDDERLATTAEFRYDHEINQISGLEFDVSYGLTDDNSNSLDTYRTDVTASYNRELTEDWLLKTGVKYKIRDTDLRGSTDSTSVFLSIERDFNFYR